MNHALAVSALIGSILDNDHVACLQYRSVMLARAASLAQARERRPRAALEDLDG